MTDTVYEQIMALRKFPNCPSMFDIRAVFELALEQDFNELADYIFSSTEAYSTFILTGQRD